MPAHLTEDGKDYWKHAKGILSGLLDELERDGRIKKYEDVIREKQSVSHMISIVHRVNSHMDTAPLLGAFISKSRAIKKCLIGCEGFTVENVNTFVDDLILYDTFSRFLESTEALTKFLLFILIPRKPFRETMTFGEFVGAVERACPAYGHKFALETDAKLRNAIAHGTYWFSNNNGSIYLNYCDKLDMPPTTEFFGDVLCKMRNHNLLGNCLSVLLTRRFLKENLTDID